MTQTQPLIALSQNGRTRDPLLATKIGVPGIRQDLLARPRLVRRLDTVMAGKLILVSAPAGFGKTTLLAGWARNAGKAAAWLSLDKDDNDPVSFWRYVTAAIESIHRDAGQQALSLLDMPARPTVKAVVMALVNALAAHPVETVLILDDYHLIESPAVHESLVFLLEHLPPEMHVVISARSDPSFPVARFRARGELVDLRASDLRFTLEEAGALLRRIWRFDLPEESLVDLVERTEGWAAGLQLAALSLKGTNNPQKLIRGFTGSHRYVFDYLSEEVLDQQPVDVQSFLLETSILERLSASLCDMLTGRSDSQKMLEHLERANLFLTPLDDERRWYRYHHLFADLLQARLKSSASGRLAALNRNAASWFEQNGPASSALRHALAAGDEVWAARLVEQNIEDLLRRGEGETLRGWLALLPPGVVHSRPRLALAQVIAAFNAGRFRESELFLVDAEKAPVSALDEPFVPSIGKEMSMLVNIPASIALLRASLAVLHGDALRASDLAISAQGFLGSGELGPLISIRWNLAQAGWMSGHLQQAGRTFAEIVSEGKQADQLHLTLTAGSVLSRIQQAQGRLEAAFHTSQDGLDFLVHSGQTGVLSAAVAHVELAQILYERSLLQPAVQHAGESITLGRQLTSTQTLASGLAAQAWIRQALGDPAGAREAMDEAYQVIPDPEIVSLFNPVPAERARLLLVQGDIEKAAGWLAEHSLEEEGNPGYPRELEYLVLSRVLLGQSQAGRALGLLERMEKLARAQGRVGSLIKILALQALALQSEGKTERASEVLLEALQRGKPEGYIRTFVDEGQRMATMIDDCRLMVVDRLGGGDSRNEDHRLLVYVEKLLSTFTSPKEPGIPENMAFDHHLPPEILSEREREVLDLLARGASNHEIAETLTIALTTARKHVSNIIGKLEVHNRTQAVSRGRELGLLK